MTHILVKHKVNDYETWKSVFDNFLDVRKSAGEQAFQIYHAPDNPNELTLFFKWDSVENAKTFMSSSELKSAMQKGGVAEEPKIQFLDEVANGAL